MLPTKRKKVCVACCRRASTGAGIRAVDLSKAQVCGATWGVLVGRYGSWGRSVQMFDPNLTTDRISQRNECRNDSGQQGLLSVAKSKLSGVGKVRAECRETKVMPVALLASWKLGLRVEWGAVKLGRR
jgi:hypothetical protein